MESLVNYGSDDESADYSESIKNEKSRRRFEEDDANYDEIGMDESSEESNNNHAEHFAGVGRERRSSCDGGKAQSGTAECNSLRGNHQYSGSSESARDKVSKFDSADRNSRSSLDDEDDDDDDDDGDRNRNRNRDRDGDGDDDDDDDEEEDGRSAEFGRGDKNHREGYGIKRFEEDSQRRHSSDMEMDDGKDDLDNYVNTANNEGRIGEGGGGGGDDDLRQKFASKTVNYAKGKGSGDEKQRTSSRFGSDAGARSSKGKDEQGSSIYGSEQSRSLDSAGSRDERLKDWDKRKDFEESQSDDRKSEDGDRKRDECRRDERKPGRREHEERTKDAERDRRRDSDKQREERDRRRSPERREHGKKRSHSPDKRERERERDRERERERDRERDRERERRNRSSDRRSPKHSRRSSRSPDRSWKARKLEKKTAVLNKLGIEIKTDVTGNWTPRQLIGEQLKNQIQEVEAKTGVTLPTYYNPGVMNPLKYAQQIQKRKLLWGNKGNANKGDGTGRSTGTPASGKQWVAATFKGDSDGKMTEKFKRLMGIKDDTSAGGSSLSAARQPETKEMIQKQEELFSNMEAQYQVARMATHTHRGVGLGFGTFQVPPR